jgi:squalene-hopene/tetraprenyl-beta-curcumene cyclase
VPDADDTPGALLALSHLMNLEETRARERATKTFDMEQFNREGHAQDGVNWLLGLQNADGGWPTFCRGWGHLPFDRSGGDLTAHALRAIACWLKRLWHGVYRPNAVISKFRGKPAPQTWQWPRIIDAGFAYLARTQRPDGSWLPLWFGNQHMPDDENPTYGTARVLAAYRDLAMMDTEPARKGIAWLLANQNPDGGWGGGKGSPSSIEETALAIDVLVDAGPDALEAMNRGLPWLVEQIDRGKLSKPTPIGFYFAKLWYFEKLYPIIFTVSALGRIRKLPV